MNVVGCEDDLLAELPALLGRLHAGEVGAVQISHRVGADGTCHLTVELVRNDDQPDGGTETPDGQPWEYRWP